MSGGISNVGTVERTDKAPELRSQIDYALGKADIANGSVSRILTRCRQPDEMKPEEAVPSGGNHLDAGQQLCRSLDELNKRLESLSEIV